MCSDRYRRFLFLVFLIYSSGSGRCDAISNTQFNASIREYAVAEDSNSTDVRTLQKELHERYAQLAPVRNPIRFKEIPDSQLAPSSAYGRGLLHLNHHGYSLNDYEESPYHGYAYEYHVPDDHHGHYDDHDHHHDHDYHHDHDHHGHLGHYGHHIIHHDDHKHGYGHHHKYYDHALAAKTVLWPIAGIALLGAAAALVSNPVLLQLGVVSGKRRRRDTEEITTEERDILTQKELENVFVLHNIKNFNKNEITSNSKLNKRIGRYKRGMLLNKAMNNNHKLLFRDVNPTVKETIQSVSNKPGNNGNSVDKHYIPIPLMFKEIDST